MSNFQIIYLNNYELSKQDIENISKAIKLFFQNKTEYVIIKNNNMIKDINELIPFYELLNNNIGTIQNVDTNKYTDSDNNYWVNVKYDFHTDNKNPWRSNSHLKLHTDNTISTVNNYAQLTELVCLEPCKYSGLTTIINNNYIVELIKYVDKNTNDSLFSQIYEREIYYSSDNKIHFKNKILNYDNEKNNYIFSFNHTQAIKSDKNTDLDKAIVNKLNDFLEEKIMNSNLMDEIKLNMGDALMFNDELVMHGRRSVISNRHYKKCSIFIESKIQ